MQKEKTVVFIGHSDCYGIDVVRLKETIEYLILDGFDTFLNGGKGHFDYICAEIVYKLKEKYPHIKNYLIVPYINNYVPQEEFFDEIIYPEKLSTTHYKGKIQKRNRYMIEKSSVAVCYVNHSWGGAAQSYAVAERKGLRIINLAHRPH